MQSTLWFAFIVGFISFAVAQALWLAARLYLGEYSMWVFETTPGLIIGGAVILSTCAWMGRRTRSTEVRIPVVLFCGAGLGMATAIIWVLPLLGQTSNIWPIALIVNWMLLVPLVFLGWALGLSWRNHSKTDQSQPPTSSREA